MSKETEKTETPEVVEETVVEEEVKEAPIEEPAEEIAEEATEEPETDTEEIVEDTVDTDPDARYIVKRVHELAFGTLWYSGEEGHPWTKRQSAAKELTQAELDELQVGAFKEAYGQIVVYLKTIVPTVKWVRQ